MVRQVHIISRESRENLDPYDREGEYRSTHRKTRQPHRTLAINNEPVHHGWNQLRLHNKANNISTTIAEINNSTQDVSNIDRYGTNHPMYTTHIRHLVTYPSKHRTRPSCKYGTYIENGVKKCIKSTNHISKAHPNRRHRRGAAAGGGAAVGGGSHGRIRAPGLVAAIAANAAATRAAANGGRGAGAAVAAKAGVAVAAKAGGWRRSERFK